MQAHQTAVLTEFNDDIANVCDALLDARSEIEELNNEIEDLKKEAREHVCE